MDQYDNIVLKYLKSISFVNQQNLTEETSHERIVCVEGEIYVSVKSSSAQANWLMHNWSLSLFPYVR